jgi:hypothetical protein
MDTMKYIAGKKADLSRYRYDGVVINATSAPVLVENTGRDVLIAVMPGTSANVQYTLSSNDKIEAATALWFSWPSDVVTVNTQDAVVSGITGLRLVSVGTSTWEVVA